MPPKFYQQEAPQLAKALLGQILVHNSPEGRTTGRIVETEAYLSVGDLASHSARGKTKRNTVMFGPAGRAYIYFTYGMHWLFNVTAGPEGVGEAALIRALEPIDGIQLMMARRQLTDPRQLCNGPAKLTQAMGLRPDQNGSDLATGSLQIVSGEQPSDIITTTRIGIKQSADSPLRFYIKDNPYISKP